MDSILHGSLLRIQSNKSFWLEVKSRYYTCLQNDAYIDCNEVQLAWNRDLVLESREYLELEIGMVRQEGLRN
jgi:hypothetical protein